MQETEDVCQVYTNTLVTHYCVLNFFFFSVKEEGDHIAIEIKKPRGFMVRISLPTIISFVPRNLWAELGVLNVVSWFIVMGSLKLDIQDCVRGGRRGVARNGKIPV